MRRRWISTAGCALALALVGCDTDDEGPSDDGLAGDSSGDDGDEPFGESNDDGADGSGDDGPSEDATFSGSIAPILSASCGCHVAGSGGLAFDGDPYGALVEVPAVGADLSYVEPGDVEASYLVHKLRGTQGSVGGGGSTMPLGGSLSEDQIETIEAWIEAGAPE